MSLLVRITGILVPLSACSGPSSRALPSNHGPPARAGHMMLDSARHVAYWCPPTNPPCRPVVATNEPGQYLHLQPSPSGRFMMIQQSVLGAPFPDRDLLFDVSNEKVVFDWVPAGAVDDGWTTSDAWFSTHDSIGCDCGTTDVLAPDIGHLTGCWRIEVPSSLQPDAKLIEIDCKDVGLRFQLRNSH